MLLKVFFSSRFIIITPGLQAPGKKKLRYTTAQINQPIGLSAVSKRGRVGGFEPMGRHDRVSTPCKIRDHRARASWCIRSAQKKKKLVHSMVNNRSRRQWWFCDCPVTLRECMWCMHNALQAEGNRPVRASKRVPSSRARGGSHPGRCVQVARRHQRQRSVCQRATVNRNRIRNTEWTWVVD